MCNRTLLQAVILAAGVASVPALAQDGAGAAPSGSGTATS